MSRRRNRSLRTMNLRIHSCRTEITLIEPASAETVKNEAFGESTAGGFGYENAYRFAGRKENNE